MIKLPPLRLSFRNAPDGIDFAGRVAEIAAGAPAPTMEESDGRLRRVEVIETMTPADESDPAPGGRLIFDVDRSGSVSKMTLEEPSGQTAVLREVGVDVREVLRWLERASQDPFGTEMPNAWFRGRDMQVIGGAANEDLAGRVGDDVIRGGEGFDTIYVTHGHDAVHGGGDIDRLVFKGASDGVVVNLRQGLYRSQSDHGEIYGIERVEGGRGDDLMRGWDGDETFLGGGGDDRLYGGRGADLLFGGKGADVLFGGQGGDALVSVGGDDSLLGGRGADALFSESDGDVWMKGGDGRDFLSGGAGNDTAYGGRGGDVLALNGGDDVGRGGQGHDVLFGDAGDDRLAGGRGADGIWGGEGADLIFGGRGEDSVGGGAGADRIHGGLGDDLLAGDAGADRLFGGAGADRLYGGDGADRLYGGEGADTLVGGKGADRLEGGDGDDVLTGDGVSTSPQAPEIERVSAPSSVWEYVSQGGTGWSGAGLEITFDTGLQVEPWASGGADVFVLDGRGVDTVVDFEQGMDRIELGAGVVFEDLRFETQGDDLRLLIDASDQAIGVLQGEGGLTLDESDFIFV